MKEFNEVPKKFVECKAPVDCCDTIAGLIDPTVTLTISTSNGGNTLSVDYAAKHECGIKRHIIKVELTDTFSGRRWETEHHFLYNSLMVDPRMHLNWGEGALVVNPLPENLIGKVIKVRLHIISECSTSIVVEQRYGLF